MTPDTHDRALSTTVSLLVVMIGVFVAMSPLYSATDSATERMGDALADQQGRTGQVIGTDLNITSATWDLTDSDLTVTIENTGERVLDAGRLDTIVDGNYVDVTDYERLEVEGQSSEIWRPGEELTIEDEDTVLNFLRTPDTVKVITGPGVSNRSGVTSV